MIDKIIFIINNLFQIYFWLILVRCFMSFIPSIDWSNQPFAFIREITDFYLDIFRKIIPPFSGIDFSPIVAVIFLQILNYLIVFILFQFRGVL